MDSLEKAGKIQNTFINPFYRKPPWEIKVEREGKKIGVINPFREEGLDRLHPGIRAGEQKESKF
jgi:hypothetical protein